MEDARPVGDGGVVRLSQWDVVVNSQVGRLKPYHVRAGGWRAALFVIGANASASAADCPTATLLPPDPRVVGALRECAQVPYRPISRPQSRPPSLTRSCAVRARCAQRQHGHRADQHSRAAGGDLTLYKVADAPPRRVPPLLSCPELRRPPIDPPATSPSGDLPRPGQVAAFGLASFDFALFLDVDVTLLPFDDIGAAARRWAAARALLTAGNASTPAARWPTFIANADQASPVNAGLWLVRPSAALLGAALHVLKRCRFNTTHGWELAGPPRQLLRQHPMRHPDGKAATTDLGDRPATTLAARHDKWDFLGADIDQGFLWYFFYVRRPRGALFRYSRGASRALHWYGKGWSKPWNICEPSRTTVGYGYALADQRPAAEEAAEAAEPLGSPPPQLDSRAPWELGRAYAYLHYSHLLGAGGVRASPCARRQWAFRRAVEDDERFYDLPGEKVGMTVPFFAVW